MFSRGYGVCLVEGVFSREYLVEGVFSRECGVVFSRG